MPESNISREEIVMLVSIGTVAFVILSFGEGMVSVGGWEGVVALVVLIVIGVVGVSLIIKVGDIMHNRYGFDPNRIKDE